LRTQRRLRVAALMALNVIVLVGLPVIFLLRSASTDPVYASLNQLSVPAWADKQVADQSSGSSWCHLECELRERTVQSEKAIDETAVAYTSALTSAGWTTRSGECAEQPEVTGKYTCWQRDEFTLDLWVKEPECKVDQVAAQDPAMLPSLGPDGVPDIPDPSKCTGSTVSIKVQTAFSDPRGKPAPPDDPSQIGEAPDAVPDGDGLLDPTPAAS
jgi:hypothetical protein